MEPGYVKVLRVSEKPMQRWIVFLIAIFPLILSLGCMSIVNGATNTVGAVAGTTVTAAKAGGTMLKDAATGTMNYASEVWKQAARGNTPEQEEPPLEP